MWPSPSILRLLRRGIGTALLLIGCFKGLPASLAQPVAVTAPLDASTATAVYLLNFIRFTEWPESTLSPAPTTPYVIGISGNRDLLDALIRLFPGQSVRGRPLLAVRIKSNDDLLACHLAYFEPPGPRNDQGLRISTALKTSQGLPILTVSTDSAFINDGGLIQLFNEDSHLRFSIAADSARAAGLTINSRLLALSRMPPKTP